MLPRILLVRSQWVSRLRPYLAALAYLPARKDDTRAAAHIRFTHSWHVDWFVRKNTRIA